MHNLQIPGKPHGQNPRSASETSATAAAPARPVAKAAWLLLLLALWLRLAPGVLGVEVPYPAIPSWEPDPSQRAHLHRSLSLMQSSTPTKRNTVRVLFYGQSITQQGWWKEVEHYLRATYTNANFIIENRAIGGHASQLLVKTAEADLYPFQPDLLIFHVYGSHIEYENIIKRVRERTCADVLLQTDHITSDASLSEETAPAKLSPKQWDAWMNHAFLPATAEKYGACRADIHERWKDYLRSNHLKAADLLKDGVHLNAHGEWLMAELLKRYLAPLPTESGYDPLNEPRVHTVRPDWAPDAGSLRVEFTGTRVDVLLKSRPSTVSVRIDGNSPSSIPELYGFSRVTAFPNSDWPILLKVGSAAPLIAETWSLTISQVSDDGKACRFNLKGSVTGPDGEGWSTNHFASKSGRVVIEPEDWNLAYCYAVFKHPLPPDYTAHWNAQLRGEDGLTGVPGQSLSEGIEWSETVAQGLPPGPHSLELKGPELRNVLNGLRVYCPQP